MRAHRFYIGGETPDHVTNEDLVHQWRNVFRMKTGDPAILFGDYGIEYACTLTNIDKKSAAWSIETSTPGKHAQGELILCAALIKKDNFDLVIRQATEIGATRIVPIISERSEKKGLNMDRARRILIEASEQCGRVDVPAIDEPTLLDDVLTQFDPSVIVTSFDPRGEALGAAVFASKNRHMLMVGPEGGWTESEIETLALRGRIYSLPTFVLRAETAAVAVLTVAKTQMLEIKK